MVKIRLTRTGKKHQPSYRIVAIDSRKPRDGRHIEILGHYHPSVNPPQITINLERYNYWLTQGAQPTASVKKLKNKTS